MHAPISFAVTINGALLRGFLIQAVNEGGDGVGTFTDLPALIPNTDTVHAKIGECMPDMSSATHNHMQTNSTNREDFPYVMLNWTAPAAETGPIRFR